MEKGKSDYRSMIHSLMNKHQLDFSNNSSGAEITHPKFGSCYVHLLGNYKRDHETLLSWLKEVGLE
jgi:hypothetical protein